MSAGTAVSGGGVGAASSTNVPYPAGVALGDGLLIVGAWHNPTATPPGTPSGWTGPAGNSKWGGDGASYALDAGPRGAWGVWKEADAADVTASAAAGTVAVTNGNSGTGAGMQLYMLRIPKTLNTWVEPVFTSGEDTSVGTAFSVTGAVNPGGRPGDRLIAVTASSPDTPNLSSVTCTWTGDSTTAISSITNGTGTNTSGHDVRGNTYQRAVGGVTSAAPVFAGTFASNAAGVALFIRLRDVQSVTPITETDTVVALGRTKSRSLTPITETETVVSLVGSKSRAVTPAAETDTVVALTGAKSRSITPAAETDSVVPLAGTKARDLTVIAETGTVVPLAATRGLTLTPVTETDSVVTLVRTSGVTLTPIEETDSVVELAATKARDLSILIESEVVVPLRRRYPTPASRCPVVEAEERTRDVAPENRIPVVPAEQRFPRAV